MHALFALALVFAFALRSESPVAAILIGVVGIGALGYSFLLAVRSGRDIGVTGNLPGLAKSAKYTAGVSVACAVLAWVGLLISRAGDGGPESDWWLAAPLLLLGGAALALIMAWVIGRGAVTANPDSDE
jgi:hypothetical protein